MWLMTRFGFFSVVQKDGESHLTIRSRTRGDLDRLRGHYLPQLGPGIAHAGTDYPWRATASQVDLANAFKRITEDINYANFKDEVAMSLGEERAHRYSKVWAALAGMPEDLPEPHPGPFDGLPWKLESQKSKGLAYGGVIIDPTGRILLREVANHYDGYVWTFPKGRPSPKETPRETALRKTTEETGVNARILCPIPGEFAGGTTINYFFLMVANERGTKTTFQNDETSGLRWVNPEEAKLLIAETTNSKGRKRDLDVLDAALSCIPEPLPLKCPITLRESWITKPMPSRRVSADLNLSFTQAEMARIHRGYLPYEMEQKWFIFYEDGTLHIHRSWTGICIYRIHFTYTHDSWLAKTAEINRHSGQYQETRLEADLQQIKDLIQHLLLRGQDEPGIDSFVLALQPATKPNYLGSPEVVSGLLGELFEAVIDYLAGKGSQSGKMAAIHRVTAALAEGTGGYIQMPGWHIPNGIGKAIIHYFDLDPDHYADENLTYIVSEGLAAIALKIGELVTAFEADPLSEWPHALEQLNAVHMFSRDVLLGTNALTSGDKTLKNFLWEPASTPEAE